MILGRIGNHQNVSENFQERFCLSTVAFSQFDQPGFGSIVQRSHPFEKHFYQMIASFDLCLIEQAYQQSPALRGFLPTRLHLELWLVLQKI